MTVTREECSISSNSSMTEDYDMVTSINDTDEDVSSSLSAGIETPSVLSSDVDSIVSQSFDEEHQQRNVGRHHHNSADSGGGERPTLSPWDESSSGEDNDYDHLTHSNYDIDKTASSSLTIHSEKDNETQHSQVLNWLSSSTATNTTTPGSGSCCSFGAGPSNSNSILQMPNSVNTGVNNQLRGPPGMHSSANTPNQNDSSTSEAISPNVVPLKAMADADTWYATTKVWPSISANALPAELSTGSDTTVRVNFLAFGNSGQDMLRLTRILANKVPWENYGVMSVSFFFGQTSTQSTTTPIVWTAYSRNSFGDLVKINDSDPCFIQTKDHICCSLAVVGYTSDEPVSFNVSVVNQFLRKRSIPTIAVSTQDDILAPKSVCRSNGDVFMTSKQSIFTQISNKKKRHCNVYETVPVPIGELVRNLRASHILGMMDLYPQRHLSRWLNGSTCYRGPIQGLTIPQESRSFQFIASKKSWIVFLFILASLCRSFLIPYMVEQATNHSIVLPPIESFNQDSHHEFGTDTCSRNVCGDEYEALHGSAKSILSSTTEPVMESNPPLVTTTSSDVSNITVGTVAPPMQANESQPLWTLDQSALINVLSQSYNVIDAVVVSLEQWLYQLVDIVKQYSKQFANWMELENKSSPAGKICRAVSDGGSQYLAESKSLATNIISRSNKGLTVIKKRLDKAESMVSNGWVTTRHYSRIVAEPIAQCPWTAWLSSSQHHCAEISRTTLNAAREAFSQYQSLAMQMAKSIPSQLTFVRDNSLVTSRAFWKETSKTLGQAHRNLRRVYAEEWPLIGRKVWQQTSKGVSLIYDNGLNLLNKWKLSSSGAANPLLDLGSRLGKRLSLVSKNLRKKYDEAVRTANKRPEFDTKRLRRIGQDLNVASRKLRSKYEGYLKDKSNDGKPRFRRHQNSRNCNRR